jgi:hypothetical protein
VSYEKKNQKLFFYIFTKEMFTLSPRLLLSSFFTGGTAAAADADRWRRRSRRAKSMIAAAITTDGDFSSLPTAEREWSLPVRLN